MSSLVSKLPFIGLLITYSLVCTVVASAFPSEGEVQYFRKKDPNTQAVIDAVFHEARSEPMLGQILVVRVIKNRAADAHWRASTFYDVVHQPEQFSFTLLSDKELKTRELTEYSTLEEITSYVPVLLASPEDPEGFEGVNHYLRCDVRDDVSWEDNMEFLGSVGSHCFYKGY